MKVFHVGHGYMPNSGLGVIEYLYQSANQLVQEGVEVAFIQFDRNTNDYVVEVLDGISLYHFPKYKFKGISLPECFKLWLDELVKVEQNFIFHLHSVFFFPNYSVSHYLQQRNIPYIHTPHDSYSAESMKNNRWLKEIYIIAFERCVMNGAKAVHAITTKGAKSIAQYTSNPNIKIITNSVPKSPQPYKAETKRQICFIGRMDIYQKGIDLMLESFAEFKKKYPGTKFILAGQYLDKEIEVFNKLFNKHKLSKSEVNVMGKVSNEEKYRILSETVVYFQMSRFEGFGLSIVEALSMRKPVIISDNVPICHIIQDYEAGYIVSNVLQAIASLSQIFNMSQVEYETMSKNALNCYQENFRPEAITKQLIKMYEESLYSL